jgi:hypothetical protein
MEKTIIVIGNGPSLRGFDFAALNKVDTLGMNAAYRYWDRINWYPTHYCCLDSELIATHHQAIKRLVEEGQVKTAFLDGRFLEFFPDASKDKRYVFLDQFLLYWYQKRGAEFGLPFIESSIFQSAQPSKVTTGSYSVRYAIYLGYQRVALLGIDLQYIEQIPEAENTEGIQLVMKKTPSRNPNYFFDDYQQAGDKFQIPNPKVHNFDLHPTSFESLRDDILLKNLDVEVINCNLKSELHARGILPYKPLWKVLDQPGLGALVIPTQVREREQILNNLKLWQVPGFTPFLHLRGRKKPKLIFTFTGVEDEALKQEIIEEFQTSELLQNCFSELEFYFFVLPDGEDIYIRDRSLPVGKKGYKSGPNQQFFRGIFALQDSCHYAFFMETDCVPLRPDWLGALYDLVQTAEEFWILGSPYKGQDTLARKYARHINGNAIYAVGDRRFIEFVKKWQALLDETTEKIDSGMAYDCLLENFFADEFGSNLSSPFQPVDPSSEGWKLFQEISPYLRYTNYILNYSAKRDLEKAEPTLLLHSRKNYSESYILHNRIICDSICRQILAEDFKVRPKAEEFAQLLDVLDQELASGFTFCGIQFEGKSYPTQKGFVVGNHSAKDWVVLHYNKAIELGDLIQVDISLLIVKSCKLSIGFYPRGCNPFEGVKRTFHCQAGTEKIALQLNVSRSHDGISLEFGSDDFNEVELILTNISFHCQTISQISIESLDKA